MKFEHLSKYFNLVSKILLVIDFYVSFSLEYLVRISNQKLFVWKLANYADSYWFMFNSKRSNQTNETYTK